MIARRRPGFLAAMEIDMTDILTEIADERGRQIAKGYDPLHDDAHTDDALADAAAYLAHSEEWRPYDDGGPTFPDWAEHIAAKWNHDRRRQLVIAAALLVAEIERLDRI